MKQSNFILENSAVLKQTTNGRGTSVPVFGVQTPKIDYYDSVGSLIFFEFTEPLYVENYSLLINIKKDVAKLCIIQERDHFINGVLVPVSQIKSLSLYSYVNEYGVVYHVYKHTSVINTLSLDGVSPVNYLDVSIFEKSLSFSFGDLLVSDTFIFSKAILPFRERPNSILRETILDYFDFKFLYSGYFLDRNVLNIL